jgi:hypothetical protein
MFDKILKFFILLIKDHIKKTHGCVEVWLYVFLTSALYEIHARADSPSEVATGETSTVPSRNKGRFTQQMVQKK